ncbi:MAG: molybdopterin-dependent oxidoreductase [Rhodospirillaceae bacterium]|nr:molybdopterin-dependent oxidoreductase [Rhodospirillaceae bacterium]MBL6929995.1 molybdopterin-dependent oxidoreductase [Rhodospirillales bacterium]MBL6941078.1 molybdopterin-dependent oxidoreductase [Rhodospirillales bacterium]
MSKIEFDRRDFLKVMGVSGVAATVAGCDMPSYITSEEGAEEVIPYLSPEEFVIPGVGVHYASTCLQCPATCGIRGRVREGRVLKLEGNPKSALNTGKLCQMGQAGLQTHYNPDRLTKPLVRKDGALAEATWEDALALIEEKTGPSSGLSGGRFAWLTGTISGHQSVLLKAHLESLGSSSHFVHEVINTRVWQAVCQDMLGQSMPRLRIDKAKMVLSFGADFLGTWMSPIHFSADYARFRSGEDRGMLVQAEPSMSLTGANADLWVALRPGTEGVMALGLANVLINKERMDASALPAAALELINQYGVSRTTKMTGIAGDRLIRIARHLKERSPSLVLAGASAAGHVGGYQSVQAAMLLNILLGNIDQTIEASGDFALPQLASVSGGTSDLSRFADAAGAGKLDAVFFDGSNPLFAAPNHLGLTEKFDSIPFKVAFSQFMDETTAHADVVLPMASALEDWGTHVAAYQGGDHEIAFQQPLMEPIYPGTRSFGDMLLALNSMRNPGSYDGLEDYYGYLQSAVGSIPGVLKGEDDEAINVSAWNRILQDGRLQMPVDTRAFTSNLSMDDMDVRDADPAFPYYLVPTPRGTLYDGRHANIPWLQESPDQISKVVWNSWAEIHPVTAAKLAVEEGDVITVTTPDGVLEVPVYIHKGIHVDVVAVPMGQGHEDYGRYARGRGVNPLKILQPGSDAKTGELALYGSRAALAATGRAGRLIKMGNTETQHGRKIVATITAEQQRRNEGDS